MLADAERVGIVGTPEAFKLTDVGVFHVLRPTAASAAYLAQMGTAKPRLKDAVEEVDAGKEREATITDHLTRFVEVHMTPDGFEDLLLGMVDGRYPSDTVTALARALATWGTARQFPAVSALCAMTGKFWRVLRARLAVKGGLTDPLAQLPTLHVLIDVTESAVMESITKDEERDKIQNQLYAPELNSGATPSEPAPPSWWDADDAEDSFNALMAKGSAG